MVQNKQSYSSAVDVHQARELLQSDNTAKIIDVRTPAEFESAHIPGSYNMPLDQLPEHQHELGNTVQFPIILVCRSGNRAEQALHLLQQTNLPQLHVLMGVISAWEREGFPVKQCNALTGPFFGAYTIHKDEYSYIHRNGKEHEVDGTRTRTPTLSIASRTLSGPR
jgi:rhodanese-related sulfurtransferase